MKERGKKTAELNFRSSFNPEMISSFTARKDLTVESGLDWSKTRTRSPSFSAGWFLCGHKAKSRGVRTTDAEPLGRRRSPFALSPLVVVHVLQLVQLGAQRAHVCAGLQQRRAQLLVLLTKDQTRPDQMRRAGGEPARRPARSLKYLTWESWPTCRLTPSCSSSDRANRGTA